ncbi:hypothetical protein [Pseudomonas fluorescens]|uniref:Uncharacterized protein n=1 Tax=Pseudomonas fluorescens TaxID=294 RepID=A0A5E7PZH1_PSEFL|nr:hypothetical protein [Pseudomonas fluorescens]VVP54779.1 hypothetical protein PS880_05606 [Pseudomonas fluorescens]
MIKHLRNLGWATAFVLTLILGMTFGRLSVERRESLDFWCVGESAHRVIANTKSAWLITRFRLNLIPVGPSHMRMIARVYDADSGVEIGSLRRNSAFRIERQGARLQISVLRSAKGDGDDSGLDLPGSVGMFIFQSGASLSYWIRPLTATRYLIDDGNDTFILCSRR